MSNDEKLPSSWKEELLKYLEEKRKRGLHPAYGNETIGAPRRNRPEGIPKEKTNEEADR